MAYNYVALVKNKVMNLKTNFKTVRKTDSHFHVCLRSTGTICLLAPSLMYFSIPYERLLGTLGSVGWPVLQSSLSVLLGILPLATVNSYVVQSCFKTVLLIIIIGKALYFFLQVPVNVSRGLFSTGAFQSIRGDQTNSFRLFTASEPLFFIVSIFLQEQFMHSYSCPYFSCNCTHWACGFRRNGESCDYC